MLQTDEAKANGHTGYGAGGAEPRRPNRLLDNWGCLVDSRVGIVQEVRHLPPDDDDPQFFHYLSRACDTARFTALSNFGNNGGVSTTRYGAMAKALGEAVERYCGAIFDYGELEYSSYENLGHPATHPETYALYRDEQYRAEGFQWKPFTVQSPISWTMGRSLATGEAIMVPAAMVFIPYHYLNSRPDEPIVQPISTGIACGDSFEEAAIAGLCEVVERDAFTLTWQARMAAPHIAAETLPPSVVELLRRFEVAGLRVELMDITTDIEVPTALAVALSDAETSPAIAVAAATDSSPERAMTKTLEELAHTRKFAKQLMEFTPEIPVEVERGFPAVRDQTHHLRLYCPQGSKRFAEFAWASAEHRAADEMGGADGSADRGLSVLVDELVRGGFEPVACDLTTDDVAALGLRVVRVVVPGMHPLYMGHRSRALGGRRLYTVPQVMGYPGLRPGQPDNPYPHPFP